jgi:hypothetical protein
LHKLSKSGISFNLTMFKQRPLLQSESPAITPTSPGQTS